VDFLWDDLEIWETEDFFEALGWYDLEEWDLVDFFKARGW
jgi:hypothetical protein